MSELRDRRFATPLLFRALTVLLPAGVKPNSPQSPSLAERCHGAMIANNLASAFSLDPPEPDQSITWSENALYIAEQAIEDASVNNKEEQAVECRSCKAVAHFNRGIMREMDGNTRLAKEDFQAALRVSREHHLVQSAQRARSALERIARR